MLEEVGQVVVECTRLFEVLQRAVLSISFASLRLQSEVSCEGAAQVFEILSEKFVESRFHYVLLGTKCRHQKQVVFYSIPPAGGAGRIDSMNAPGAFTPDFFRSSRSRVTCETCRAACV